MMALLYETVPAFEDTWIECLGDLSRYRMAIEEERDKDREIWAGVARTWYTKAADKNPTIGRLYHHLAILARPNALQQLYHYSRSLTCVKPFLSARESILTLLDPILARTAATYARALPIDTNFIKAHALLPEKPSQSFEEIRQYFMNDLDSHIGSVTAKAFKAWATTMFHYELLDCVESYKPKEHIIKFLGLSVIFVFIGSALQQSSETSLLVTFPPSLALAAVISWAITKKNDAADQNRHQENPPQREADLEAGPHDQPSRSDRSRRNSNSIGSDLPHPSNFTIGTDSDLESLRSRQ
ncbi:unnamed protein product [Alternaria alternata]